MTIQIITPIYNEEYLLPIFIEHYDFIDKFIFLIDADTNDKSLDIIKEYQKKYNILYFINSHNKIDDDYMIKLTNDIIYDSKNIDYSLCVDCDELIFNKTLDKNIKNYIKKNKKNYYNCMLYHMLPNYNDNEEFDLNVNTPIWKQRKYGYTELLYNKPCLVYNNFLIKKNYKLDVGKHFILDKNKKKVSDNIFIDFYGAHLNKINLELAINRIILNRKNRVSDNNKRQNFSWHYKTQTVDTLIEEFDKKVDRLW